MTTTKQHGVRNGNNVLQFSASFGDSYAHICNIPSNLTFIAYTNWQTFNTRNCVEPQTTATVIEKRGSLMCDNPIIGLIYGSS